jgi:hypothetical protein
LPGKDKEEYMKWLIAIAAGAFFAALPFIVAADDGDRRGGFVLRVNSNVHIAESESNSTVVVINGNAVIDGKVENAVVINGNATVRGRVEKDLTVISGNIDLLPGAHVANVASVRGNLYRAEGAVVTGTISERQSYALFLGWAGLVSVFFWAAVTFLVVVAGLVFAAIGGKQLERAARTMTEAPVETFFGVLAVFIGLPILGVLLLLSLFGIPLGIAVLLFVVPLAWFLGYIVAGARLGSALIGFKSDETGTHPYGAVALGLVILQLLAFLPVLGALIGILLGAGGAGAIALNLYRAFRARRSLAGTSGAGTQAQQRVS